MNLLQAWRNWRPKSADYCILKGDEPALGRLDGWRTPIRWSSWKECEENYDPWATETPLHLGLCPLPFVGDVANARVYFLLLNPGLCELDYFAEYCKPDFAQRLRANLRQDFRGTEYPFFPLDPRFAWHSGSRYWQNKLAPVIKKLADQTGQTHARVRKVVAQNVCAIELVPYHSVRDSVTGTVRRVLESARLARDYVHDVLIPEARSGSRLIVAMRSTKDWGIHTGSRNVRRFQGGEALGARLSTAKATSHGTAVVRALTPLFAQTSSRTSKLRA